MGNLEAPRLRLGALKLCLPSGEENKNQKDLSIVW